jgi:hypothetical protein
VRLGYVVLLRISQITRDWTVVMSEMNWHGYVKTMRHGFSNSLMSLFRNLCLLWHLSKPSIHDLLDPARSMRLTIGAVLVLMIPEAPIAAELGTTPCKDWETASRTFYTGPEDKVYAFYQEANRWIIGRVLGSPIRQSSEVYELIESRFGGSTRDPNAVMTDVVTSITDKTLDYCRKHPLHSIAAAADMLLKTK